MTPIESVSGISLITPGRLENLVAALLATTELDGDMAELGVYRGGSAKVICSYCPDKTLHLFDTFTGLPYEESPDRNPTNHPLPVGRFACPQAEVESLLSGCNIAIHPGVFPFSAFKLHDKRFSFAHIDCDLYQSCRDAIDWFWPKMTRGGIMFFDDYGCDFTGVTDAVHESFSSFKIHRQSESGIQIGAFVLKE